MDAPATETTYERKLRMLEPMYRTCMACSMCSLGRRLVDRDGLGVMRDPHVFSNQNPTRFLVFGQNPGFNEVIKGEPFVGDSGNNFDVHLVANGLSRLDFYISNVVKCLTDKNARPEQKHIERCRPFVDMEVNLLRPLLIVALGGVAFEQFCPGKVFADGLGTITMSRYEVPVFAVYHPSPLNLEDAGRRVEFAKQMRLMCGLVKHMKAEHGLETPTQPGRHPLRVEPR